MGNRINKRQLLIIIIAASIVILLAVVLVVLAISNNKNQVVTGEIQGALAPKTKDNVYNSDSTEMGEYKDSGVNSDDDEIIFDADDRINNTDNNTDNNELGEQYETDTDKKETEIKEEYIEIREQPIIEDSASGEDTTQETNEKILMEDGKITLTTKYELTDMMNFISVSILNSGFDDIIRYAEGHYSIGGNKIDKEILLQSLTLSMERIRGYNEYVNTYMKEQIWINVKSSWNEVYIKIDETYNKVMNSEDSTWGSYKNDIVVIRDGIQKLRQNLIGIGIFDYIQ